MGEQYRQLLISCDKDSAPSAAEVREFLAQVTELGVVPGRPAIVLRVRSGKTREFPNPFSDRTVVVELKDNTRFKTLEEFESAAAELTDFEAQLSGEGRPKLPPLEIDFDDPYYIGVTCFVSSVLRSTSAESYGQPCDSPSTAGVFLHPETCETIDVPEAGEARFWVEFELGKFLAPKIAHRNLELLHPAIVQAANEVFGGRFVQGCGWG